MPKGNKAMVGASPSPTASTARDEILITHANPEDNAVARWLAARLTTAGYRVWVDVQELRGGDDFWNVIEDKLRHHVVKQIALVSRHVRKRGVLKELALGDGIGRQLGDDQFIIPIRVDDIPYLEFPTELLRLNALEAFPNWAGALPPLLKTLEDASIPRRTGPDTAFLASLVDAQQRGRLTVLERPETLLTNWFPITEMPELLTFYGSAGLSTQLENWLANCQRPHLKYLGLAGAFTDARSFQAGEIAPPKLDGRFWIKPQDILTNGEVAPFPNGAEGRRQVVNLLRQHWDLAMRQRGLRQFEYASGEIGWFFPDGLVEGRVKRALASGKKVDRVVSGKFKDKRWHLALIGRPRLWPVPMFRVHANMVLTLDGKTALPGKEMHAIRRRLTRSWWNDKWRDLLLAGLDWVAEGEPALDLAVGLERLKLSTTPLEVPFPVSYEAEERRDTEEGEDGEILLGEDLETGDGIEHEPEPEAA